jgi:hypothetical protein
MDTVSTVPKTVVAINNNSRQDKTLFIFTRFGAKDTVCGQFKNTVATFNYVMYI